MKRKKDKLCAKRRKTRETMTEQQLLQIRKKIICHCEADMTAEDEET